MKRWMVGCAVLMTAATAFAQEATTTTTQPTTAASDGMLPTPQMGWNSWNTFQTKIDETLIKGVADAMIANGMRDAGYVFINLDDGWSEKERDANGELVGDHKRFPSGMKALGDYLHERGFKYGLYNCCGTLTCAGYPGEKGHEEQDMKTYASWGVDYLKIDWCHTEGMKGPEAYKKIHEAIVATGRPMILSMCEWGQSKPWLWADGVGQSWRTTGDITDLYDTKEKWSQGWKLILDQQNGLEKYAGPGHWNDPDMLEVGNRRLTPEESRAHFSFWCLLAAPLIAGNDVRHMSDSTKAVLTNPALLAIDQDSLGKQGFRVAKSDDREIWIKPMKGDAFAVCVLNASKATNPSLEVKWSAIPQLTGTYAVRDVWESKDVGDTKTDFSGEVKSHDVKLFMLTPAK